MRILILNQYALPAGSAGITRHGDIGAELVRRGHEVTVIASDFDYLTRRPTRRRSETTSTNRDPVEFVWLRTGTYLGNDRKRVASMVRYAMSATRAGLTSRPGPDVVIGSSPQPLAALAASFVARLRKVPWIFEVRDFWPSALVDMKAIERDASTYRLLERLERHLYASADAVVSVPPRGALRIEELGLDASKCVHIPNAAPAVPVEPGPLPDSLNQLMQDANHRFLLVYTGAIGVMQDFATVLAGVKQLRERKPELYRRLLVLIVGGGVAADATQRRAADLGLDQLHVHPAVAKATAQSLVLRADACLLTLASADAFRFGLSPNKLLDYLAAGKPTLISSSHPTLVDEAEAGLRYEPGSPASLAEAIVTIMTTSTTERDSMGERGRRLAESSYSIKAITDQYETLLQDVVARHRRLSA
jgi:glycosyltransferase involved in cell wall biosynthesis